MLLLGIDLGSSSVKASVIEGETGRSLASSFHPKEEMKIMATRPGWAEQDTAEWWENIRFAVSDCVRQLGAASQSVGAIGISYQMHGLVAVDRDHNVLRPSIIWCDSRAVEYGERALAGIGREYCQANLLNSPGNFTAAKLAWVKEHEPGIYARIYRIMLPGDFVAMKLTGEISSTYSGLSEGIFWDIAADSLSDKLMDFYGFDRSLVPGIHSSFAVSGHLLPDVAADLGLPAGIPVSYRAGDQPNNALSLNVLEPGEVAATAGTSGVIYGVTDKMKSDSQSRVNTFLHVNHSPQNARLGVLLCISGTGILNSWIRRLAGKGLSYSEMNGLAMKVAPGCEGLFVLPFGNGAERMLGNSSPGAKISGINFNIHGDAHLFRACQEGIAFSFRYGLDILRETGIDAKILRAGEANMFLSPVFRQTLSDVTGTHISLYNTDGSAGAARGAGIGCGYFRSAAEAFHGLRSLGGTEPSGSNAGMLEDIYQEWKKGLESILK
jgi:xylulokinase